MCKCQPVCLSTTEGFLVIRLSESHRGSRGGKCSGHICLPSSGSLSPNMPRLQTSGLTVLDHSRRVSTHGHDGYVWMLTDENNKTGFIHSQCIPPECLLLRVTCSSACLWCPEGPGVTAGGLVLSHCVLLYRSVPSSHFG